MKTNVLGVQYDNVTMAEALDTARALLQRPEASYCVTPNAEMAYEALHDESFRAILNEASLVLPDGAGVVLGALEEKDGKSYGMGFDSAMIFGYIVGDAIAANEFGIK